MHLQDNSSYTNTRTAADITAIKKVLTYLDIIKKNKACNSDGTSKSKPCWLTSLTDFQNSKVSELENIIILLNKLVRCEILRRVEDSWAQRTVSFVQSCFDRLHVRFDKGQCKTKIIIIKRHNHGKCGNYTNQLLNSVTTTFQKAHSRFDIVTWHIKNNNWLWFWRQLWT